MATLVIQLPNMPPVEHILKEEFLTIGRMNGNTIALDDGSVSLSHARLTRVGGDYYLKDLNSTNGTKLNGQSITEARLRDGDYVKFGEVTGRYHANSVPQPAHASPPAPVPAQTSVPMLAPARSPAAPMQATTAPVAAPLSTTRMMKPKRAFIPALAGMGVTVVIGFVLWKFVFSGPSVSTSAPAPNPSVTPVPPATTALERPPAPAPEQVAPEPVAHEDMHSLIQSLKASSPAERRRAAEALNALGPEAKEAVPYLRRVLNDSDPEVRMWAALSLIHNKMYDKATVPILLQVLHHENPVLRQMACLSLGLIPYDGAEKEPVVAALTETANKDDNAEVQNAALSALKMIAPETAQTAQTAR